MKTKIFILVLFTGGLLLNACQKDIDVFVPDPGQMNGPDTSWQTTITPTAPVTVLKNNLKQEPYKDTIIVDANTATIITPFGVQLTFPPHCCNNGAGQPVTGKVDVELIVLKKKGDMIRLNRPSTYNDSMLVTAGEIFIQLKQNGQPLQLAPGVRINIRYTDLPINPLMKFFVGDETNAQHYNWLPTNDPSADTIIMGSQIYEIYTKRQGWLSAATLFEANISTPKVKISLDAASYFTNANTTAFVVFKDVRSVVELKADLITRKFMTGKLPVGKQVTVVVISKQGNDYYLGYESATTQIPAASAASQPVPVVPIKKSLPEILAYLSTL
ncbi:MAG: hypothetical protein JNM14_04455 [Ferruginibacter sp.]|nr:hypothetical protein [Ferruginibacter sp.]